MKELSSKMNICIYSPLDQCFHDCENCPQADDSEPDWDLMREIERERED